jgi:hypothetical protein
MWSSTAPPGLWKVTLVDGSVVDVWADSVEGLAGPEDDRDYLFSNLLDVPLSEQAAFEVTSTAQANPEQVVVTVARFPRSAVAEVVSG